MNSPRAAINLPSLDMMKFPLFAQVGCVSALIVHGAEPTLKDAFERDFLIGVALNESQIHGSNPVEDAIVKTQFNSISPESCLKGGDNFSSARPI